MFYFFLLYSLFFFFVFFFVFFFKQKTAYEIRLSLVGSEMCIRDSIARSYFLERGMNPEIIKLHGSIELAPLVGLAEGVVDLTSTGTTLWENQLEERFQLHEITTRMIVNRVSHKMLAPQVSELVSCLRAVSYTHLRAH